MATMNEHLLKNSSSITTTTHTHSPDIVVLVLVVVFIFVNGHAASLLLMVTAMVAEKRGR